MCDRAGLLIGWDDANKRALVCRANCDSWECIECAKRMSENWGFRAELGTRVLQKKGYIVDFVTITSHEKLKTFSATESVWRSAWSTLYAAIKRKQPALEYMIVPERHKDGRMHVHCIWNAEVSQRWLKDNARKRGLGYQCKVIHLTSERSTAKYVSKYIGKDLGTDASARFRRVRVSNGWADLPQPTTQSDNLRWEYVGTNGALSIVYDECQSKRITLIDQKTGQIFDDIDLGTIVQPA